MDARRRFLNHKITSLRFEREALMKRISEQGSTLERDAVELRRIEDVLAAALKWQSELPMEKPAAKMRSPRKIDPTRAALNAHLPEFVGKQSKAFEVAAALEYVRQFVPAVHEVQVVRALQTMKRLGEVEQLGPKLFRPLASTRKRV